MPAHFGPELDQIDLSFLPRLAGVAEKLAVFLIDMMDRLFAKDVDLRPELLFAAGHFHEVGNEPLGHLMLDDDLVDFTGADRRLEGGVEKMLLDRHVDREPDADVSRDRKEYVVLDGFNEIEHGPQDLMILLEQRDGGRIAIVDQVWRHAGAFDVACHRSKPLPAPRLRMRGPALEGHRTSHVPNPAQTAVSAVSRCAPERCAP